MYTYTDYSAYRHKIRLLSSVTKVLKLMFRLATAGDGMMKKHSMGSAEVDVEKNVKPVGAGSTRSTKTWRDMAVYILSFILVVQVLALFMWLPRCWRLRYLQLQDSSPYSVEETTIGTLSARVIKNSVTGEKAVIIVDFGGRVEELQLLSQSQGKLRDVLLTHNGNATAIMENEYWKGMLLIPWANRIAYGQYTFFGQQYSLKVNENGTYQNALHGLLANKQLKVDGTEITQSSASLLLSFYYDGTSEPGYPFRMNVIISYTLSEKGFMIALTIANAMPNTPLPLYVGWHPYFACTAYKAIVTLDPCTEWNHVVMDSNFDPTGVTQVNSTFDGSRPIGGTLTMPTFYDDEFKATLPPSVCHDLKTRLYDPDTQQTVVLWQAANFRFVHIFTGSMSRIGENAIAIEPMSAMADAYNNHDHLSTLSGGEMWTGEFGVYVE